jgi:hypothetical protein
LPGHPTRGQGGGREPHLPADQLERQLEQLYELQQLDRELLDLDGERRKLLAAYYADAIDLGLLRQDRPGSANAPAPWKPAAAP